MREIRLSGLMQGRELPGGLSAGRLLPTLPTAEPLGLILTEEIVTDGIGILDDCLEVLDCTGSKKKHRPLRVDFVIISYDLIEARM
jgi:hypothetical protein